jgi:hypothetical protein
MVMSSLDDGYRIDLNVTQFADDLRNANFSGRQLYSTIEQLSVQNRSSSQFRGYMGF